MSSSSTDSDLAELQEKHNAELAELQEKFDSLTSEQDDLLVLLAHQDKKIAHLKSRFASFCHSGITILAAVYRRLDLKSCTN